MVYLFKPMQSTMKHLKYSILTLTSFLLFACSNTSQESSTDETEKNATEQTTEANDLSGMKPISLADYSIPAEIYIPDENQGKAEISETPFGSVRIAVADRYGLEIVPFGLSVEEKKSELQNDMVFTIEIVEEEPNYFIYKKSIKDSDLDPEVHFFMNMQVEGDIYELKSIEENAFSQAAVNQMLKSAKSFQIK